MLAPLPRTPRVRVARSFALIPLASAAFATLAPPVLALPQGSDSCATAQVVVGYTGFAWNLAGAGSSPEPGFCSNNLNDRWFQWVAPDTTAVRVSTCGFGLFTDDELEIFEGTQCNALVPVACPSSYCGGGLTSYFNAQAGTTYRFRVADLFGFPSLSGASITGAVNALGCPNPSIGPDLTLARIQGSSGTGNGSQTRISFQVGVLNRGDSPLDHAGPSPSHSVAVQNAYRHEGGRFEQIGLSWAMHEKVADQGDYDCDCRFEIGGQRLGAGCTDHDHDLNDAPQLGPRSEINPVNGALVLPFTGQGDFTAGTYRTMWVDNSELDPALHPQASYYYEVQYVSGHDALFGHHRDNVGHDRFRPINPYQGGWFLQLQNEFESDRPAIRSWPTLDPGVHLEDAEAPNDGLFVVGSLATGNGDGSWDYEYAVYNQDSQRACGTFEVPLPPGAILTNVGFHDVDHHSGEVWDSTDWTATVLPDRVRWTTTPHSVDPNANAIRWGTLYNFRFTTNVPPTQQGRARLGLFEPGTPDHLDVRAWAPSGAALGTAVCSPAVAHSGGVPGRLIVSGSDVVAEDDLHLLALDLPAGTFGYFLASRTTALQPGFGGSQGTLCLGQPFARLTALLGQGDAAGTLSGVVDLGAIPTAPPSAVQPGESWRFQAWYRDGSTSNFTDAVLVDFL